MKPVLKVIEVESQEGKLLLTPEKLQEMLNEAYELGWKDAFESATEKAIQTPPSVPFPQPYTPVVPQPYNPTWPPYGPIWCESGDNYYGHPLVATSALHSDSYCVLLRDIEGEEALKKMEKLNEKD